jgi:cytochrome b561
VIHWVVVVVAVAVAVAAWKMETGEKNSPDECLSAYPLPVRLTVV